MLQKRSHALEEVQPKILIFLPRHIGGDLARIWPVPFISGSCVSYRPPFTVLPATVTGTSPSIQDSQSNSKRANIWGKRRMMAVGRTVDGQIGRQDISNVWQFTFIPRWKQTFYASNPFFRRRPCKCMKAILDLFISPCLFVCWAPAFSKLKIVFPKLPPNPQPVKCEHCHCPRITPLSLLFHKKST